MHTRANLFLIGSLVVIAGLSRGASLTPALVQDIDVGGEGSYPGLFTESGGKVFFATRNPSTVFNQVWRTDGTEEGTVPVKAGPVRGLAGAWGNQVAMVLVSFPVELWKSDGTEEGTERVKQLETQVNSAQVKQFVNVGDLLFVVIDVLSFPDTGSKLWRSDGTAAGTFPLSHGSFIRNAVSFRDELFFVRAVNTEQAELWKSDGSTNGTSLVQSFPLSALNAPMQVVGDRLFFLGGSLTNVQLFVTDGTPGNATLLKSFSPDYASRSVFPTYTPQMAALGGALLFTAQSTESGLELWRSDGTANGTVLLKTLMPGLVTGESVGPMASGQGRAFFKVFSVLWTSDGTSDGTVPLTVPDSPSQFSYAEVSRTYFVRGRAFFWTSEGGYGSELWTSDGTPAGTRVVQDLLPGTGYRNQPNIFASTNGTLYFGGDNGTTGEELWKVDVRPKLQNVRPSPAGGIEFEILDTPGMSNVVEFSTDLIQWQPLATNNIPASGLSLLRHTNNAARSFYRTRPLGD